MTKNRTSPSRVRAVERRQQAVAMRKAGAPLRVIGEELGVTTQAAHKAIKKQLAILERLAEGDGEELRRLTIERYDAVLLAVWDKAMSGNLRAVDRVLKIEEARHNLLGTKVNPLFPGSDDGEANIAVIVNMARTKLSKLLEAQATEAE